MKIKLWNYFQLRESILSSLNYCPYELAHRNIIWSLFLRVFIWAMCQSLIISCTARKNSRMKELLQLKSCVSSSGLCRVCSSIFVLALSVKNDLIMEDMIITYSLTFFQVAGTIQAASQAPSSPLTVKKKVTAPVRKPRMPAMPVTTPTVPLEMNATSTNATLKRNISQVPEKETKKPPRKRTKAGEGDKTAEEGTTQSLQSSNENNAALPVVLGPPMGNVVRTTAVLPNGLTGTLIPLGIAFKKAPVAKAVRKPPVKKETKSSTFLPPSSLTTPLVLAAVGEKPSVNGGGIIGKTSGDFLNYYCIVFVD